MWILGTTGIDPSSKAFRGEAQIRHINQIPLLPHTHQEILRLDVSMNDALGMDIFETVKELVDEHQHSLERDFATAEVEKVFQTRPQKIKNHSIILTLRLISVDSWNTDTTGKEPIGISFAFQQGGIDKHMFEFDSDIFAGIDVDSLRVMSLKR